MTHEADFWALADRMFAIARMKGLGIYGDAPLDYRFEIPVAMWEYAKEQCARWGWAAPADPPRTVTGYRLLGYPFVVNPALRPNELLLVRA